MLTGRYLMESPNLKATITIGRLPTPLENFTRKSKFEQYLLQVYIFTNCLLNGLKSDAKINIHKTKFFI